MDIRTPMKKLSAGALVLSLSTLLAGIALAGGPMGGPMGGPGGPHHGPEGRPHGGPDIGMMMEHNAERLGLSDETIAKIRDISDASRKGREGLEKDLDARSDELRKLLDQDAPDRSAVMAKADAIGALKTKLRKSQLEAMLDVRALLTPEQRKELTKLHEERRDRRQERREMRREGRGDREGMMGGPPPEGRRGMDMDDR